MKPVSLSLLLCAALLGATPARADDWDDCRSTNPDKQMAGCTAVIEKRDRPAPDLALAHRIRGSWYARRDMFDRALGEFDNAVRLAPDSASALIDRTAVLRRLGQLDRALADAEAMTITKALVDPWAP
jgi:tetratricopeptide (TPR) repeat protein